MLVILTVRTAKPKDPRLLFGLYDQALMKG